MYSVNIANNFSNNTNMDVNTQENMENGYTTAKNYKNTEKRYENIRDKIRNEILDLLEDASTTFNKLRLGISNLINQIFCTKLESDFLRRLAIFECSKEKANICKEKYEFILNNFTGFSNIKDLFSISTFLDVFVNYLRLLDKFYKVDISFRLKEKFIEMRNLYFCARNKKYFNLDAKKYFIEVMNFIEIYLNLLYNDSVVTFEQWINQRMDDGFISVVNKEMIETFNSIIF